jgi:hypothetical protein
MANFARLGAVDTLWGMGAMRRLWVPFLVLAALSAPHAWAEPPPGIVMAISGDADPGLPAMAEIPANTPVRLGAATEMTFLHYIKCKLVTVVGGTLTLTRADYKADGRVASETDGPCPHVHSLSDVGSEGRSAGGLIARGMEPPPHWPAGLDIIFSGSRGGQVKQAAVIVDDRPDQPLLRLDVAGSRVRVPAGAPALQPGKRYRLRLTMAGSRDAIDVPFIAAAPTAAASLVILRVD